MKRAKEAHNNVRAVRGETQRALAAFGGVGEQVTDVLPNAGEPAREAEASGHGRGSALISQIFDQT